MRYTKTVTCKACQTALGRLWRVDYKAEYAKRKEMYASRRKKRAEYHRDKTKEYYRNNLAKEINRARVKDGLKRQHTPSWADHARIRGIYNLRAALAKATGKDLHVDHIIPLQGENVCGLHVHYNLTRRSRNQTGKSVTMPKWASNY